SGRDEMGETGITLGQLDTGFLFWTLRKRVCPRPPPCSSVAIDISIPVLWHRSSVRWPVGRAVVRGGPPVRSDQCTVANQPSSQQLRFASMDEHKLHAWANHYRRVALLVSDD